MKKIVAIVAFVALLFVEGASAQSNTSYFMEGSYFRTELNPALAPTRGYLALPGMSGVGLNVENNFLSVDNFFYKRDNQVVTALNGQVSADEFLGKLPELGKIDINANVNILGVGFYAKRMFWNFGLNLRSQSDIALSKDLFTALKTFGNGTYDLTQTSLSSNNYLELYLGSSFPVCKFVNVGVRAKFLVGLMNATATFDELYADIQPEAVQARLRGTMRLSSPLINAAAVVPGSELTTDMITAAGVMGRIKSFGAAIDLGTEIRLLDDHLRISAAVTDLGFIKWSNTGAAAGNITADAYFDGINFSNSDDEVFAGEFNATMGATPESYTTMLRCALNVGVEYAILRNRISFGLLSHTEFCNTMKYTELTASVNLRPLNWLSATVSHTFLNHNKLGVLGFALNLHPPGFNLFVGADYIGMNWVRYESIPVPYDMKSVNVYAGIGFNFGRPKHLKTEKPKKKDKKND